MKSLPKKYHRWRFRRLYRKLMFEFIKADHVNAIEYSSIAFEWITGVEWIEIIREERKERGCITQDAPAS